MHPDDLLDGTGLTATESAADRHAELALTMEPVRVTGRRPVNGLSARTAAGALARSAALERLVERALGEGLITPAEAREHWCTVAWFRSVAADAARLAARAPEASD